MKKFFVLAMLVIASVTAWAQQFTPQEQELIDLSNQKWAWMSEKNADKLAELFHDNAMFVHMGGSWGFFHFHFSLVFVGLLDKHNHHGNVSGSLRTLERKFWFKALMAFISSSESENVMISRFSAK